VEHDWGIISFVSRVAYWSPSFTLISFQVARHSPESSVADLFPALGAPNPPPFLDS